MADLRDDLKARLAMVRRHLDRTLDRFADAEIDWAPKEGMRTVGGMIVEIVGKEIELMAYARTSGAEDWVEIDDLGGREKTLAGCREALNEARKSTLAYIDSASDADLEACVKFPGDWWEGLYREELAMHEVIRNIAMHEWYHTGQLVSYLWIRGDDLDD